MIPQPQFQTSTVGYNYQMDDPIATVERNCEENEPQLRKKSVKRHFCIDRVLSENNNTPRKHCEDTYLKNRTRFSQEAQENNCIKS